MTETETKQQIIERLAALATGPLPDGVAALWDALGYRSERDLGFSGDADSFADWAETSGAAFRKERAHPEHWERLDMLFQFADDDIRESAQSRFVFDSQAGGYLGDPQSYLFAALDLKADQPLTRTELSEICRELNRPFPMPVLVVFRQGASLTLAVIDRRLNKRDTERDVLQKVTLIKDIALKQPHRAHVEILFDLSLLTLQNRHRFANFAGLHDAWRVTLDTRALNRQFFEELTNWYFWARQEVVFPNAAGERERSEAVIRLLTRLIFVWFLKEKKLVPEALFLPRELDKLLLSRAPEESTFYKAILQNLFFATLNTEVDAPRRFRGKSTSGGRDGHHMIHNVWRYESSLKDPAALASLLNTVPFLNGGLFECLDRGQNERFDGFSDRDDNPLSVPNSLFFSEERPIDLDDAYGEKKSRRVRGLITLLDRYKFTIDENTPIEQEIALDPELLGKVFENLLASYNPETRTTARKQTGSFYTPREIVDYMVDEALLAHFQTRAGIDEKRLRLLLGYNDAALDEHFTDAETDALIAAIDSVKILDPACGSGAFPMGALQKLVFLLAKLDPKNARWKQRQLDVADAMTDMSARDAASAAVELAFENRNRAGYGRKLYLIQECIYGVDIQPIAVQIAKLRFFISLVVDQNSHPDSSQNFGVLPLPNLETKFVAANALLPAETRVQLRLPDQSVLAKRRELSRVRRDYFEARTRVRKERCREEDRRLRGEIAAMLRENDDALSEETAQKLADWDPYDHHASASFFDSDWMYGFPEFDITIGNPPYVRADSGSEHVAQRRIIAESGLYETLHEKWDFAIPFIERGYKLLRPGGVTSMIVSDGFCHAKYAIRPQEWYRKNARILRLDFYSKIKIFDAAVRNISYLFQKPEVVKAKPGETVKSGAPANLPLRRVHDPEFGAVVELPTGAQESLTHRLFFPEDGVAGEFTRPTIPLSDICYISKGMVVNADEDGSQGAFRLEDVVSETEDAAHPKRFVEGKHLDRWLPRTHKWLEWGTDRAPSQFSRRTFPELYDVPEKLFILRVAGADLKVCFDDSRLFANHTATLCVPWASLATVRNLSLKKVARYQGETPPRPELPRREALETTSARFSAKYLLAVMNSSAARDFLRANRRSNTDLYPDDWKKLPIPDASAADQARVVAIVERILDARRADAKADVGAWEREIDVLVTEFYGIEL